MISVVSLLATAMTLSAGDLELISYHRLNVTERFDLSGMLKPNEEVRKNFAAKGDFLLISDHSSIVYDAKLEGQEVNLVPLLDLRNFGAKEPFDLEGIEQLKGSLYIVNEAQENLVVLHGPHAAQMQILEPGISLKFPAYNMGNRFGLEGIAILGDRIFLAKEKTPLAIFETGLDGSGLKIHEKNPIGSQSDLKFRGDDLYILERERRCIIKTRLPLRQKEICLSFKRAIENPQVDYWRLDTNKRHQPQWGNAEALEFDGDDFWIGIDNNGNSLKASPETRPSLLRLR